MHCARARSAGAAAGRVRVPGWDRCDALSFGAAQMRRVVACNVRHTARLLEAVDRLRRRVDRETVLAKDVRAHVTRRLALCSSRCAVFGCSLPLLLCKQTRSLLLCCVAFGGYALSTLVAEHVLQRVDLVLQLVDHLRRRLALFDALVVAPTAALTACEPHRRRCWRSVERR